MAPGIAAIIAVRPTASMMRLVPRVITAWKLSPPDKEAMIFNAPAKAIKPPAAISSAIAPGIAAIIAVRPTASIIKLVPNVTTAWKLSIPDKEAITFNAPAKAIKPPAAIARANAPIMDSLIAVRPIDKTIKLLPNVATAWKLSHPDKEAITFNAPAKAIKPPAAKSSANAPTIDLLIAVRPTASITKLLPNVATAWKLSPPDKEATIFNAPPKAIKPPAAISNANAPTIDLRIAVRPTASITKLLPNVATACTLSNPDKEAILFNALAIARTPTDIPRNAAPSPKSFPPLSSLPNLLMITSAPTIAAKPPAAPRRPLPSSPQERDDSDLIAVAISFVAYAIAIIRGTTFVILFVTFLRAPSAVAMLEKTLLNTKITPTIAANPAPIPTRPLVSSPQESLLSATIDGVKMAIAAESLIIDVLIVESVDGLKLSRRFLNILPFSPILFPLKLSSLPKINITPKSSAKAPAIAASDLPSFLPSINESATNETVKIAIAFARAPNVSALSLF